MRGEKWVRADIEEGAEGSPPRARGKERYITKDIRLYRITPACAGKRAINKPFFDKYGDHPRVRGEKLLYLFSFSLYIGSPPRARGKVISYSAGLISIGITPACAGKSFLSALF